MPLTTQKHLCPGLNASIVNNYFMLGWFIWHFHITSNLREFKVCFGELFFMRTLCDTHHKKCASHWHTILDIDFEQYEWKCKLKKFLSTVTKSKRFGLCPSSVDKSSLWKRKRDSLQSILDISALVYKWVTNKFLGQPDRIVGSNLQWTSIPSRGSSNTPGC